ncbi:MAG: hypothetical protein AMXMBFR23_18090 [Chloroflexota bacterium]
MSDAPFHFSPRPNRAAEIPWAEWGAEAFARAQTEDRPVLLLLAVSWSHRSHLMDEVALTDPRVIDLLRSRFVAVRVDADERPDVSARYHAGDWPTTAFLTPEGDVIAAAAYLDAEEMLSACHAVQEGWLGNREGIAQQVEAARAMRAAERAAARAQRGPGALTPSMLDIAVDLLDARFDADAPGLIEDGAEPGSERAAFRFPHPEALRLWRYHALRRTEPDARSRARDTWRAMTEGGLFDHRDGGFFRHATRPDWSEPSFEKLARDQGGLMLAAAELAIADIAWRDEQRDLVERLAAYVIDTLGDAQGGIGNAQDADEAYHAASEAERALMLPPAVDGRVFTSSCAVAARGLIALGVAVDRRDWRERGLRAVDFLLSHARAGQAGMYHAYDGTPHLLGILDDQAQMLLALLEAYEVSGQPFRLEQARWLARAMDEHWLEPGLGFRDVAFDHEDTALLAEPAVPIAANVAAAEGFLWLARLTHDDRYLSTAAEVLAQFAHGIEARGLAAADYARVVDRLLSAEPEFKIIAEWPAGEPDRVADPLHRAALRLPLASRTVQRLNPEQDDLLFYALGLPRDVVKVAYVCSGHACSQPITAPESLLGAVEEVLAAPSW